MCTFPCKEAELEKFIERLRFGERLEINLTMFHYWIGLFPYYRYEMRNYRKPGGKRNPVKLDFHSSGGETMTVLFWRESDRYFCKKTAINGSLARPEIT